MRDCEHLLVKTVGEDEGGAAQLPQAAGEIGCRRRAEIGGERTLPHGAEVRLHLVLGIVLASYAIDHPPERERGLDDQVVDVEEDWRSAKAGRLYDRLNGGGPRRTPDHHQAGALEFIEPPLCGV